MIHALNDEYYVRPLRPDDVEGAYPTWFEDPEVTRYSSHGRFFYTPDHYRAYVESMNDGSRVVWAVCHNDDGHIGNVNLQGISLLNRNAEFAILLGDRNHWGRGLGQLAARCLFLHGFERLHLERIHCGLAATNEGMRRLAEKLGMTHEGTRRRQLLLDGEWIDVLEYGLLRDEFRP